MNHLPLTVALLATGLAATCVAAFADAPASAPAVRLTSSSPAQPPSQTPSATEADASGDNDWVLSFDDEFDGAAVDPSRWLITNGTYEQREDVQQFYSPTEVNVSGGSLFINCERKETGGRPYTSGDLRTFGRFGQCYGLFAMRARVPTTVGIWPAFWLLPAADTWPPEIDICESGGGSSWLCCSNHWGTTMATHGNDWKGWGPTGFDLKQWHTYAVDWEPGSLTWYVDGQAAIVKPAGEPVSAVPMYMRLNTAVGSVGGDPTKGVWPQLFQVDWVRAYRHKDQPPPVCAGPNQIAGFAEGAEYPSDTVTLAGYSCNPLGDVKLAWAQVSGPGKAVFADRSAAQTDVRFTKPGSYRLRLTATDGAVSASDDTVVLVDGPNDDVRTALANAGPLLPFTTPPPTAPAAQAVSASTPTVAAPNPPAENVTEDLTLQAKANPDVGQRLFLKFDISGARRVTSARLRINCGIAPDGTPGSATFGVYAPADTSWTETGINTTNMPALGGQIGSLTVTPDNWRGLKNWLEIDVTPAVKAALAAHADFVTLCLVPTASTKTYDVTFHSRMTPGLAPALVLTGRDRAVQPESVLGSKDWTLTFDDEFTGKTLDPKRWKSGSAVQSPTGAPLVPNVAALIAPALIAPGVVTPIRTPDPPVAGIAAADMSTWHNFQQTYGRFEIKAKLGGTDGSLFIASLCPTDQNVPTRVEIYEALGRTPGVVSFTNHWGVTPLDDHFDYWNLSEPGFDPAQWHVYALEWSPDALRWYVDGHLTHTKTGEPIPNVPMFVKIESFVGGSYAGDPSAGSWPVTQQIAYVRVFQKAPARR